MTEACGLFHLDLIKGNFEGENETCNVMRDPKQSLE